MTIFTFTKTQEIYIKYCTYHDAVITLMIGEINLYSCKANQLEKNKSCTLKQ